MIFYFVPSRKCPSNIQKQTGRCHKSFQQDFVANSSTGLSWKIGKKTKFKFKTKLYITKKKQEKVTNKVVQENLQRENYHTHSTGVHRARIQTSKMELFIKMV